MVSAVTVVAFEATDIPTLSSETVGHPRREANSPKIKSADESVRSASPDDELKPGRPSMESSVANPFRRTESNKNAVSNRGGATDSRHVRIPFLKRFRYALTKQALSVSTVVLALFGFVAAVNLALFFTLRRFERESASRSFESFGLRIISRMASAGEEGLASAISSALTVATVALARDLAEEGKGVSNVLQSASNLILSSQGGTVALDATTGAESAHLTQLRDVFWSLEHVVHDLVLAPTLFMANNTTGSFVELWRYPGDEAGAGDLFWLLSSDAILTNGSDPAANGIVPAAHGSATVDNGAILSANGRVLVAGNGTAVASLYRMGAATGEVDYGAPVGRLAVRHNALPGFSQAASMAAGDVLWTGMFSTSAWRTHLEGSAQAGSLALYALTPLHRDGVFEGVLGAGVYMLDVSLLLRSAIGTNGIQAFIFENGGPSSGRLVAASHGRSGLDNLTATAWEDANISAVGAQLIAEFGRWDAVPDNATLRYELRTPDGRHQKTYIARTALLGLGAGLDWMSVVFLDEEPYLTSSHARVAQEVAQIHDVIGDLEGEFSHDNWWGYSSVILQVVLLGWLWYLLQALLVRPMTVLAAQMKAMEGLTSEPRRPSNNYSRFKEVRRMEDTFESMAVVLTAFGKFVPKVVVKRIVAREDHAMQLYVFPVVVTIMFTDIANFTAISEKIPLQLLMRVLEDYLSEMSTLIEASGGVIGDFIGDGIMAFWNSPQPVPNHELMAVETMERQLASLVTLNAQWASSNVPPVWPRYGIHVGKVYSGNIGSQEKMKFGIVGDPVNLAARLESLCKHFGARNLLSSGVFETLREKFVGYLHGKVAVKGKSLPVMVYEILCRRDMASAEHKEMCERAEACFARVEEQDYEAADEALQRVKELQAQLFGEVKVSTLKCEEAIRQSLLDPAVGWDGVEKMDVK